MFPPVLFVLFFLPLDSQTLKKNWDQKKTLKQNFHDMGLAFDANAVVPMRTSNKV